MHLESIANNFGHVNRTSIIVVTENINPHCTKLSIIRMYSNMKLRRIFFEWVSDVVSGFFLTGNRKCNRADAPPSHISRCSLKNT